ncbi:Protein of unknown function [Gryllus bimaculatus]|nr:Protein of unknown function [Gryllus bimaculatus]
MGLGRQRSAVTQPLGHGIRNSCGLPATSLPCGHGTYTSPRLESEGALTKRARGDGAGAAGGATGRGRREAGATGRGDGGGGDGGGGDGAGATVAALASTHARRAGGGGGGGPGGGGAGEGEGWGGRRAPTVHLRGEARRRPPSARPMAGRRRDLSAAPASEGAFKIAGGRPISCQCVVTASAASVAGECSWGPFPRAPSREPRLPDASGRLLLWEGLSGRSCCGASSPTRDSSPKGIRRDRESS